MCSGRTSESGEFEVPGITDRKPESTAFAPYRIVMDRQTLGSLSLTLGRSNKTLTFLGRRERETSCPTLIRTSQLASATRSSGDDSSGESRQHAVVTVGGQVDERRRVKSHSV